MNTPSIKLKKAISEIGDYYSLKREGVPKNSTLIQTIFTQVTQRVYKKLDRAEKQILDRFYTDISNTPCANNPDWIKPLLEYRKITAFFLTSKSQFQEQHDPILETWGKSTASPEEQEAYVKITNYLEKARNSKDPITALPPLDLSDLGLTTLPNCLFTNPLLSRASLFGNSLRNFPEELTIGSVRNLENYEFTRKEIAKNMASFAAMNNLDLLSSHIRPFINPLQNTALINKSFEAIELLFVRKKLLELKRLYRVYSKIIPDNLNLLSLETCKRLGQSLPLFRRNQDENLIRIFPEILEAINQEAEWNALQAPNLTARQQAETMRAFLENHQEDLINVNMLRLSDLNLTTIPQELSFFTNLRQLFLSNNQITDLSPLANLARLEELHLNNNQIVHLNDFSEMQELRYINLNHNQIKNISSLNTIMRLQYLSLANNQVENISSLTQIQSLQFINLAANPILDILPLTGLRALRQLNIQEIHPTQETLAELAAGLPLNCLIQS